VRPRVLSIVPRSIWGGRGQNSKSIGGREIIFLWTGTSRLAESKESEDIKNSLAGNIRRKSRKEALCIICEMLFGTTKITNKRPTKEEKGVPKTNFILTCNNLGGGGQGFGRLGSE